MGGIIDGIKWGVILQLGVAVILPAVMPLIGNLSHGIGGLTGGGQQHQVGRPYGYDEGGWY